MEKILAMLFIIFAGNRSFSAENCTYKVIKVINGDTIFLDFNNDGIPQQEEKSGLIALILLMLKFLYF